MPLTSNSTPTVQPPATASVTQRVHRELRGMILRGEIAPGERLKVDRLKTLLNTGASPIREALSLLTSDQLVERIDQRGFRAAEASKEQFNEVFELRCSLEDLALRQGIANATTEWEESLVLAHHHMTRVSRDTVEPFESLHKTFHVRLLENCGSPILLKFCTQLYDLNIRYRYMAGRAINYGTRDVSKEHADILDAVLDHDPDRASAALLEHYRSTGEFLSKHVQVSQSDPA